MTAGLLDARFEVGGDGAALSTSSRERDGSRRRAARSSASPRPCVGRERELAILEHGLRRVASTSRSRAPCSSPRRAGVGKSRLRYEFVRACAEYARAAPASRSRLGARRPGRRRPRRSRLVGQAIAPRRRRRSTASRSSVRRRSSARASRGDVPAARSRASPSSSASSSACPSRDDGRASQLRAARARPDACLGRSDAPRLRGLPRRRVRRRSRSCSSSRTSTGATPERAARRRRAPQPRATARLRPRRSRAPRSTRCSRDLWAERGLADASARRAQQEGERAARARRRSASGRRAESRSPRSSSAPAATRSTSRS